MSIHPTPWHIPAATGPARIRDAGGGLVCTVADAATARRIVDAVNAASRPPGPLMVGGETVGAVCADGSIVFAPGYAVHSLVSDADEPPIPDDHGGCDPLYGRRMDSANLGEN